MFVFKKELEPAAKKRSVIQSGDNVVAKVCGGAFKCSPVFLLSKYPKERRGA